MQKTVDMAIYSLLPRIVALRQPDCGLSVEQTFVVLLFVMLYMR